MRGRQPATSHGARLHARASAPAANSCALALDEEQLRRVTVLLLDGSSALRPGFRTQLAGVRTGGWQRGGTFVALLGDLGRRIAGSDACSPQRGSLVSIRGASTRPSDSSRRRRRRLLVLSGSQASGGVAVGVNCQGGQAVAIGLWETEAEMSRSEVRCRGPGAGWLLRRGRRARRSSTTANWLSMGRAWACPSPASGLPRLTHKAPECR